MFKMSQRIVYLWLTGVFLCGIVNTKLTNAESLNVLIWSNEVNHQAIELFTKETGIEVNLGVYDTPEVMEAKMLAGHSGYDVVLLTDTPYLARQIQLGIYQKLNKNLIPNIKLVSQSILNHTQKTDPENEFGVPYIWGTTGIGINKTLIQKYAPNIPMDTYGLILNPNYAKLLKPCGIEILDTGNEVFPMVLEYLGKNPNSSNFVDLEEAAKALIKVKPFIHKFRAIASPTALAQREACVIQCWSSDAAQAKALAKEIGNPDEIEYIIPKEGSFIWIDSMAIPADAPHPDLAHKFINFMLRPEIIAMTTNLLNIANSVPASDVYVLPEILNSQIIYPNKEVVENLYTDVINDAPYERKRSREWTRVKTGR